MQKPREYQYNIADFTAWLATMPAEGKYNNLDAGFVTQGCVLCQFASAVLGRKATWLDVQNLRRAEFVPLHPMSVAAHNSSTYGECLAQLRSY